MVPLILTTDEFKEAVSLTRAIYRRNAIKIGAGADQEGGRQTIALAEMRRAILMDMLLEDDNLCEMLAGRVAQLQHGTRKD